MDSHTAEVTIRHIENLTGSAAWKEWWLPLLAELQEGIKVSLLTELPESETTKLRARYRMIEELRRLPTDRATVLKFFLKERASED